jgi:hypothetical protein
VSLAYSYYLFPNGVCAKPANFIDKTVGPYCIYNTPFKRYNLSYVLEKGDEQVFSDLKFSFGNFTIPTETAEKVRLDPVDTVAPIVLYVLAALSAFLAVITIPKGCCGIKWFFGRKLLNLCIATVAFATVAAASGLWTYKAYNAAKALSSETNVKYVKDIIVGSSFLAMTWMAAILMFVAMLLLAVELWLDKSLAKGSADDRRSFVRITDTEQGADRTSKDAVSLTVWEQQAQNQKSSGRVEMPGYEPLRA